MYVYIYMCIVNSTIYMYMYIYMYICIYYKFYYIYIYILYYICIDRCRGVSKMGDPRVTTLVSILNWCKFG